MRARGLREPVAARGIDHDVAGRDAREQRRRELLDLRVGRGVRAERRAMRVERALAHEQAEIIGGAAPDALPKLTHRPNGRRQSSDRSHVSLPTES